MHVNLLYHCALNSPPPAPKNQIFDILIFYIFLKKYYFINITSLMVPTLFGPRLQTDGTYRFTLVCPFVLPSVTDYLGNHLMKFSEIWYVDAF